MIPRKRNSIIDNIKLSYLGYNINLGGTLYLTPTKTAQPSIYDSLAEYQQMVLNAINIGRMDVVKRGVESM